MDFHGIPWNSMEFHGGISHGYPFFPCEVKEKDLHVTFRFVYPQEPAIRRFSCSPEKYKEYLLAGYCNPITVHIALINPVSSMHGVSFPSLLCAQYFLNQLAICKCELGFELWENREIQLSVREEGGLWIRCLRIASHSATLTPIKVVSEWFPLLIFSILLPLFLRLKNIRPIRTPSDILDTRDFSCVVSVALAVGRSTGQGVQAIIK